MTGTRDQFIPGIYRQHILAGIIIAGHQHVGIDTHGGGTGAVGSHLTATFGEQLMITLYDMAAATTYIQAWLADEDQWIFAGLPVEVPTIHGQGSIGPALSVRAHDDDDSNARIRRSTPRSFGSLITVSIRNARPSLKYSFTLECLYPTLMVTSTPLVTTRVAKTPVAVLSFGIRRPKISSTFSGRPRSKLSATRVSKNARPLRGWSNTNVRDTSTCRIDNSHQYPWPWSAAVNGNGNRGHHRSANAAMSAGPSRSQIACNPAGSSLEANPLANAVNPIPNLAACCFAHS
jgi:hypothetical protein